MILVDGQGFNGTDLQEESQIVEKQFEFVIETLIGKSKQSLDEIIKNPLKLYVCCTESL